MFLSSCGWKNVALSAYLALVLFAAAATLLAALRLTTSSDESDSSTSSSSSSDNSSGFFGSETSRYVALVIAVALPVSGLIAGRIGVAHLQRRFKVD